MSRSLAVLTVLASLGLMSAGCLQSNISGGTNGSPTSSVAAASSSGTAAGSSSASASASASATGASATGTGTGTGPDTTGTGGSSGSSTGTSTGGSSSGGSTTGPAADGGSCSPYGTLCAGDGDCCSGACLGTCLQAEGQRCLIDGDCSSGNCPDGTCECATPAQNQPAQCATNADCCTALPCHVAQGYGTCCNPIGGSCGGNWDCCDSNCVDGTCACLPVTSGYCQPGDCCTGECARFPQGGYYAQCVNDPGEACLASYDCSTESCVDGGCGSCSESGGLCQTNQDCCAGQTCASWLQGGFDAPLMDAGTACCGENGSSCDPAERGSDCCSEQCGDAGVCTCVQTTGECFTDQSCCAGGACMPRASSGAGPLACCQIDGQSCFETDECCSGNCVNGSCACVAAGGACYAVGFFSAEGPAACCSGSCGDGGVCL